MGCPLAWRALLSRPTRPSHVPPLLGCLRMLLRCLAGELCSALCTACRASGEDACGRLQRHMQAQSTAKPLSEDALGGSPPRLPLAAEPDTIILLQLSSLANWVDTSLPPFSRTVQCL